MKREETSADILLRMSLVEGFSAKHLTGLAAHRDRGSPFPGDDDPCSGSILRKGVAAATSRESGERAESVREACDRIGARIVPFGSGEYPPLLAAVADAPLVLYWWGSGCCPGDPVAVVGSRAPTPAGREIARSLAGDLAMHRIPVVSGMARGVDAAAHEGALSAGGETIAVLGCGVDVLYPPESGRLRERILARGAVVSEYPPGTLPLRRRFPARNRIISGMAIGVVVAEAPATSGALITARIALDQGREVMAVPGNPVFPQTKGSNCLLRQGAAVVTDAKDVIAVLGLGEKYGASFPGGCGKREEGTGETERRILRFLSSEKHVNEIAVSLDLPVQDLLPLLLDLEFRKLLERRSGNYYKTMSNAGTPPRDGA